MSVAVELQPSTNEVHDDRKILGPAGNRATRVPDPSHKLKKMQKPQQKVVVKSSVVKKVPDSVARKNGSVDSSCSSTSSAAKTTPSSGRRVKPVAVVRKSVKPSINRTGRCDWITAYSDPIYISFHDKEWGVPVHDDHKLFELLCLSIALAEHSWVSILCKRDVFRKLFKGFSPASVADISEEKLLSIITSSRCTLSESRVRAIVDNAKQILQVQEKFGSFSNYCWRFVNNKTQKNEFRHQRQVPVKTPKAELMSKDLMGRGFRCVGPSVVYSFMQVSGMVNDHLTTCFRHEEC